MLLICVTSNSFPMPLVVEMANANSTSMSIVPPSRNNGWSSEYRKQRLTWYIRGWLNYFKFAGLKSRIKEWDGWLRHRIRMCIWKSWKRVRTRYRNLKKLIPDESRVRMAAFCRKKYWRMASHPTVQAALSDERLLRAGYPTFKMYYHPVFKG